MSLTAKPQTPESSPVATKWKKAVSAIRLSQSQNQSPLPALLESKSPRKHGASVVELASSGKLATVSSIHSKWRATLAAAIGNVRGLTNANANLNIKVEEEEDVNEEEEKVKMASRSAMKPIEPSLLPVEEYKKHYRPRKKEIDFTTVSVILANNLKFAENFSRG